jgi:uncharacterized protein (DUF433 family)
MSIKDAVSIDSEILGGTPVFSGTRVAVKTLFDYLETSSLDDFLAGFPSVSQWSGRLNHKVYVLKERM